MPAKPAKPDALDGRVLVQIVDDPEKDVPAVAAALNASAAGVFNIDGAAVWIDGGEPRQITGVTLAELFSRYLAVKRPVIRGSTVEVEFVTPLSTTG